MSAYTNKVLTLKTLDTLLSEHIKNTDLFIQLFQKKQKMFEQIDSKKINAVNYAKLCKKLLNDEQNEDIKTAIDMEMMMLTEGDEQQWFNDLVDQSRDQLEEQKKQYENYTKKEGGGSKSTKPTSVQQPSNLQSSIKKSTSMKSSSSSALQIQRIYCLRLLDSFMQQNSQNKQLFLKFFTQKQKLIESMGQKKLTSKPYHAGLIKLLKQGKQYGLNDDQLFTAQMQADLLDDLHDGNLDEWFRDIVDTTGEEYEKQMQIKQKFLGGGMMKKKSSIATKDQNLHISSDYMGEEILANSNKMKETVTAKMSPATTTLNIPTSKFICFKYLQDLLEKTKQAQSTAQFCELYEKKIKYIDLMKEGKLTGSFYRKNLEKLIKETTIDEEREAAEMQLDFHDLTGDVNDFFQSTVNQFGENFQEQQKLYKKWSKNEQLSEAPKIKNKGQKDYGPSQIYDEMEKQKKQKGKLIKPDLSDIVSFKVLVQLLDTHKKDYDYCLQLKNKGKKLLVLVEEKKLGPNQYKQFLTSKLSSVDNKQLISIMSKQLKQYENSSNIGKLFKKSVQDYTDKTKVNLGQRKSFDQDFEIDERLINAESKEIQIQFLLRKLAKYQSLLSYYRNNQLDKQYESFKQQYQIKKNDVIKISQKLKNEELVTRNIEAEGEQKPKKQKIDLLEYVQHNLPDITFGMFHRYPFSEYQQKIDKIIAALKNSAKQYLEYPKKLKKGSNRNNIEDANKAKENILSQIEYLQSLKKKQFVPIPKIQIEKVEMYNLDLNKHLTENQIEISLNNVEGISGEAIFKLYIVNMKQFRFKAQIKNGRQPPDIKSIVALPPQIIEQIIKGTSDKKYLRFKFSEKGWFSESTIDQAMVDLNFIKTNTMQDTITTENGKLNVTFTAKVLKQKKPIVTPITVVKLAKKYEEYKHSKFVENQFLKSLMPYQKPTQSQIG